ncbi:MAG: FAD-linked oxidase C-terminal domain-containing protein [Armatimonadota bacterium]|nr:FAD-binding protein [Armatimonadota bacterium]MCX7777977.1 FAD-binding protein [Armatimonadota bacterium]MDW8026142.1 FAD-linked oxidase C-terminal domain-containing protein [Armatimonadota bacterium]
MALQRGQLERLIEQLEKIVGKGWVRYLDEDLLAYESDGLTFERAKPDLAIFPDGTEQVVEVVKLLNSVGMPFTPRGMGTGLSGGCLTPHGGAVISLVRMNRILDIDPYGRRALVEAGAINKRLSNAASKFGYTFAPDPSSESVCTIGGNVAENAAGLHTIKYGVTSNHVLAAEVVMPDGDVVWLGGDTRCEPGYDLIGLFVGNEGTFGIATKVLVKLTKLPQAYRTLLAQFRSPSDAAKAVSEIIASGILPAALEMIDHVALEAVVAAFKLELPSETKSILVVELDGFDVALDRQVDSVRSICIANGAIDVRAAKDELEREELWFARKKAFGSLGRLAPSYCTQDVVVPRSKIPEALERIYEIARRNGIRIANMFHAGDGNLHPCMLFDERSSEQVEAVMRASYEIMQMCIEMGGSITGEHGIGVEKRRFMNLMFSRDEIDVMRKVKLAFDQTGLCNPGKVLPNDGD